MSIFFLGFADELVKVAGGAKAWQDSSGKWHFKPVAMPKTNAPGTVPAPEPKFKPGSGYKPGGGAFETGKKVLTQKGAYKSVGSLSGQRGALKREGVYGM